MDEQQPVNDNSELSGVPLPDSVEGLADLKWKDFEALATHTMRCYYARYNIEIVHTDFSHDDGHDGDAVYVLADHPDHKSLAIVYRIWLEVKKRSAATVTLVDIGKNLIMASNDGVNKLVVVTNCKYAPQAEREFERFAARTNLSYSLVTGQELLALAREARSTTAVPTGPLATNPSLEIEMSFSKQPNPIDARQVADLVAQNGEPVFLIVCIHRRDRGLAARFSIDVKSAAGIEAVPYGASNEISLGAGEHARRIIAILNAGQTLSSTAFDVRVHDGGRETATKVTWHGKCRVGSTLLSRRIPESRRQLLDRWRSRIHDWLSRGGRHSLAFVAYPGVGKSVMLNHLRAAWLGAGVREIYVDGGRNTRDSDIASLLFEAAFPIDPSLLRKDTLVAVEHWLADCGMEAIQARKCAEVLCHDGFAPDRWKARQLADLCATLMRRIAGPKGAVMVVEDLHFCAPSAIDLLRDIQLALSSFGDTNAAFVCTTRPFAAAATEKSQQKWWAGLSDFFASTGIVPEHLEALDHEEAIDLLRHTVPTMQRHHAEIIVRQVGRTPLALREAVAWFCTTGVVYRDEVLDEWAANPDRLHEAVSSDEIVHATTSRIAALKARYPSWLADFLDGAACVGRFFELEAILPDGWSWEKEQREAIEMCERLDVVHPFEEGLYAFDHDLIRSAIVESLPPTQQQRIARSLADRPAFSERHYERGGLLYQAARYGEAAVTLQTAAENAMSRYRFGDAMRSLQLSISCIDPATSPQVKSLIGQDVAIAHARPPQPKGPPTDSTRRKVLDLLNLMLQCTGATAVFANSAAASFLTEAMLLARGLGDERRLADLTNIAGVRAFERDELDESVRAHKEAEKLYASLGGDAIAPRAQNLLRLGITQRSQNHSKQAVATFHDVHRMIRGTNSDLLIHVTLNIGAVYLVSDLFRVARYWRAALNMAMRANLMERRIHAMIDLGYLELLLGNDDAAAVHLATGFDLARDLELENSAMRSASNLACLHLIRGDTARALELLSYAEEIGIRLQIGRRLWRIRANLATAYEASGDLKQAYIIDSRLIEGFDLVRAFTEGQTHNIPVLNIFLRSHDSELHRALWKTLPLAARKLAATVIRFTRSGLNLQLLGALRSRLRTIAGKPRFILTE
ncbi:MAG TPA: restriction endonuclease [Thermoanaerobaculia bacterium]|nr:restriction endonuclease [Thermoanaerobaculia bacterium]